MSYHGAASDIWSCGVILFALLTGRLPFDDENIRVLLQKVKNGRFSMPADLPNDAKDLITRMLVVDPERRISVCHRASGSADKADGGDHAPSILPASTGYRLRTPAPHGGTTKARADRPACAVGEGD